MRAVVKSEFGLYGVVGGMTVIELLAGTMRRGRGGIVAGEYDMRQTYTVKHIRKGLTLFSYGNRGKSAAGEVFGCIPHGARAYRERTSLPWGLTPLY